MSITVEEVRDIARSVMAACGMNDMAAAHTVINDGCRTDGDLAEILYVACHATGDWLRACAIPHPGHDELVPIRIGAVRLVDGHPVLVPIDEHPPGERAAIRFFSAASTHDMAGAGAQVRVVQDAACRNADAAGFDGDVVREFVSSVLTLLCRLLPHPADVGHPTHRRDDGTDGSTEKGAGR